MGLMKDQNCQKQKFRLDVPPIRIYNNNMMNKRNGITNRAIDFCVFYGESSAGYNERFVEYDVKGVLEEGWKNEYIGLKKEDLGEVLDIFEEEFEVPENEYRYLEVKKIREWIKDKVQA